GIIPEVDAAQQREVAEPLGLAADLGHERAGLAGSRRQQHLHTRPQPGHSVGERRAGERARHESRAYIYSIPRSNGRMKWPRRWVVVLVLLVALTGCETVSSGGGSSSQSTAQSPRVRCLSDPSRDNQSTSRPMFFLFCAESP